MMQQQAGCNHFYNHSDTSPNEGETIDQKREFHAIFPSNRRLGQFNIHASHTSNLHHQHSKECKRPDACRVIRCMVCGGRNMSCLDYCKGGHCMKCGDPTCPGPTFGECAPSPKMMLAKRGGGIIVVIAMDLETLLSQKRLIVSH
jgi:hypothetical protein